MKPMPRNMTLEEQERWAFAEGNTALATLLGPAIDLILDLEDQVECCQETD